MIRVLLVDDHTLVRCGIRRLLQDDPDIEVIAEASSGEQAIEAIKQQHSDVVLMDVHMPGIGGLEATRRVLKLDKWAKVIVLTVHADEPLPSRFLQVGAQGYLSKGCSTDEMVNAIKTVAAGTPYLAPDVARQVALSKLPGDQVSPFDVLSQRELQVMMMVTQGHNVQEISDRLCLSPKTVSTYRSRLYQKLGVHTDVELTHLAMRHGLIEQSK